MRRPAGLGPFGVELRIVDDDGNDLPRDGVTSGRLCAGPWVVKRYFKEDQDATDADQWFDTGDVAAIHPDGTLQITDRSKDVIKSGGEWISSIELENAAVGCPGVAEAAAIGIPIPNGTSGRCWSASSRRRQRRLRGRESASFLAEACRQMVAARRDRVRRRAAAYGDRQAFEDACASSSGTIASPMPKRWSEARLSGVDNYARSSSPELAANPESPRRKSATPWPPNTHSS